jgi:mRNA-degrading endonuclease RelE of RelBE toxin-antitoxin system
MPNEAGKAVRIEFTPTFKRNLKALAKKYRHIRSDVQPIIEQLQTGGIPGDQVPGVGYTIFKVRIRNSDIQKGKSSGYRMIYYLKTGDRIILITIYSKLDQGDISSQRIQQIIKELQES